ncbi:hypothetical protein SKAU_G00221090 [Synaphobranchus kaupii]|uniref:Tenascin n=1 Tax=Synaphobranchus kaupii TaxID=118154 RepID=A0A9Q1IV03_SYNKA|nr:hypothetical protein SKAU_G00221090 [Synaphobranchus kaupii]
MEERKGFHKSLQSLYNGPLCCPRCQRLWSRSTSSPSALHSAKSPLSAPTRASSEKGVFARSQWPTSTVTSQHFVFKNKNLTDASRLRAEGAENKEKRKYPSSLSHKREEKSAVLPFLSEAGEETAVYQAATRGRQRPRGAGVDFPPATPAACALGSARERMNLHAVGLPLRVINTIQSARATSTRTLYDLKWRVFEKWCEEKHVVSFQCSVAEVLCFLQEMLDKGRAFSTIKDYGRVVLKANPAFIPKVINPAYSCSSVELRAFHPPPFSSQEESRLNALCPVRAFRVYVDRTKGFRKSDQLFVSWASTHRVPIGSVHLQSRAIADSSVTLFWTQPSVQYSTYHITFKSQREGDEMITAKVGGRLTSFTQTGLAAGQKYKVSIRGERDGKMGPESTTEFTTALSGSIYFHTRDATESSITLFWAQPSVQYSTYHIAFKSQREGDEMITAKVGGRLTSFTQSGLAAGQKYKVSIKGERDGKMGPEGNTEFTTAGSLYLRSRDITASTVTLSWTQPSVQYSTYHITFKSQREGDEMITAKVGGRLTSFTQTGLAAGQKYKVSIRGERDGKMGPDSNTEFTTAPSGSVHIRSRDITESTVTLSWTQPSVQYSTYHITFKSQREGDEMITAKVGGRLTSFTQTGLAAGQKYKVSIRGERDGKMGPDSNTEFTTAPSGSVHLRSRDITDSSVTLFWTQPSVQYSTYHITFKSQREGDKMITNKVGGRISSFTQTGLAAGQKYKVSIRGERDGKMGQESMTEFTTALSGSIYFHIRDVTESTITLFWTPPSIQYSTYHITFKSQSSDVTESSVTLFWTQPSVQYSTYHITFKSQREGDEMITAKVGGRLTSFTQTGLAAGQKYKVSIRGERDGKMGPDSNTEFTTAPSGSVHLRSRAITDSSVTLFWTQPSVQYSTYHITFKSQREADEMITAKVGGRPTSFTQIGLVAGQKYKVSIRGERDGKMGPESTTEFTTAGSLYLRSRDITESTVTLSWTQPSVQYSTYHITFKSQREGDEMIAAKVGGRLTSFTQTGLAAGQKYKVSIRGERDGKMGPESNTEFTTAPSGSVHLRSRDITDSSVTLFWTQPSVQYSTYHITFKSQREADEMITAKVGGRLTSFTQIGLVAGQKYKVSIKGERDGKMGPESTTEFTTAPSGSIYFHTRDVTESSITLFWTQPSVQYSTYHIAFKSQRQGDKMIAANIEGRLTSITQTGLAAGQKYKVSIRGERDGKMGPESTTEFSTAPSGSVHLRSRDVTESSVTLFWTQPSVQYSTYHITFKSQKEGDKMLTEKIEGRLTSFTQTGLAAGQKYKVSIRGERDGKMGPESTTEFTAAPSGSILIRSRDVTESSVTLFWTQPSVQYSTYHITFKSQKEGDEKITAKVRGRLTSFTQTGLAAGQKYKVSIRGERDGKMGPESTTEFSTGLQSKIHHFTITTGPESPSELLFSNVTDSSLSVSWTKPKSPITGFKITYTHTEDGESTSVSVDAKHSSVTLSQLSPGSSYEVIVVSVLGLKESDPVKGLVITAPDPPTGLRAVNVTDTKALLVWKPALATVDRYIIIFGSERVPAMTVKVSGNNAEHQLKGLHSGTVYTVTVTSQLDSLQSTRTTTTFTTAGSGIRREEVPQEMTVSQVTPRSVVLSWKSPNMAVTSYRLTYQRAGQRAKEVILASTVTKFKLTGLSPSSKYTLRVQGERNGRHIAVIATEFKTGSLRFPFPTDCSQELLNGMQQSGEVEVFPAGRHGRPVRVYCDMETDGGGWTVFQRRMNGETNFFRGWSDYSYGFGNLSREFWLGNEHIHNLTILRPMALRVDLHAGAQSYAHYSFFYIDGQRKHYALRVSGYSGTAGDSMRYYNGRPFSTHDKDPLPFITNGATSYRGGWWHKNCHKANMNGLYNTGTTHQGVIWTDWKGQDFSIPFTEMKLRPASFPSRTHS